MRRLMYFIVFTMVFSQAEAAKVSYVMRTDKATSVTWPKLTSLHDPKKLKALNLKMETDFRGSMEDCEFEKGDALDFNVIYSSESLFVVRESGKTTFCGDILNYHLFDLKGGTEFSLDTVIKGITYGYIESETQSGKDLVAKLKTLPLLSNENELKNSVLADIDHFSFKYACDQDGVIISIATRDRENNSVLANGDYFKIPYDDMKSLWKIEAKEYLPEADKFLQRIIPVGEQSSGIHIGQGAYTYQFRLVGIQEGMRPNTDFALSLDIENERLEFVKDEKSVFQGKTDQNGLTPVFHTSKPYDATKWFIRPRFGEGAMGESFHLIDNKNGEPAAGFPYTILMCETTPKMYTGFTDENGFTAYSASKEVIQLHLYQYNVTNDKELNVQEECSKK